MFKLISSKSKKGAYFFVIDAVIAGTIIVAALFYIFGSYTSKPNPESTLRNAEDFLNYIQTTKVREHNSAVINNMILNGNISNPDNTLYIQLLQFYHQNQTSSQLTDFSLEITKGFIPDEKNFEIKINNTPIFSKINSVQSSARVSINSKRIAYFVINETDLFGPTEFKLTMWV